MRSRPSFSSASLRTLGHLPPVAMVGKMNLLARALRYSGANRLLHAAGSWSGLIVLNYHRIGDPANTRLDRGVFSATEADFDAQLNHLGQHCEIIGLGDLERALMDARGRYALITFDDGYRDNYELAFPILRSRRLPAVFCVTTGFLDHQLVAWWDEIAWMVRNSPRQALPPTRWTPSPLEFDEPSRETAVQTLLGLFKQLPGDETGPFLEAIAEATGSGRHTTTGDDPVWMTWEMLREMSSAGMSFAGHTVTHPVLSRMTPDQQWDEVSTCKVRLEHELGAPIEAFSYPVGAPDCFNDVTRACLERAGYRWAFSFSGGYAPAGHSDLFDIPRIAVHPELTLDRIEALVTLPQLFA